MKDIELWLCRYNGWLLYAFAPPGEPPGLVNKVTSIKTAHHAAKKSGYHIIQYGIVPPDMLGIE